MVEQEQRIKIGDTEFVTDGLSDVGKQNLSMLTSTTNRLTELKALQGVLQKARNTYLKTIRQEVLRQKAGLLFENN